MYESRKKIFLCLTGSGKDHVYEILKEQSLNVFKYSLLNKDEMHEHFSSRNVIAESPKDLKRLQFFVNDETSLNNKILKNYNILLLADDRSTMKDKANILKIHNMSDYFIDIRFGSDGKLINSNTVKKTISVMLNDLLRKMR